jgi:type IV pilus assembly protein PilZ
MRRDARRDEKERSLSQCYHRYVADLRRHPRVPFDGSVEFARKGSSERTAGRCKDISLGGMYVQTTHPQAFGIEVVVHVTLPGSSKPFAIPAVVRWARPGQGMGLQFGLIGARETHAITELTRAAASR